MRFDWTISLGNILSGLTFLVMATMAWNNLRWQIKNLEDWREQHTVDCEKMDAIVTKMDKVLYHLTHESDPDAG